MCRASLVSPQQYDRSEHPSSSIDTTVLTVTWRSIIESRPRASWWAEALDFFKQNHLRQSIIKQSVILHHEANFH